MTGLNDMTVLARRAALDIGDRGPNCKTRHPEHLIIREEAPHQPNAHMPHTLTRGQRHTWARSVLTLNHPDSRLWARRGLELVDDELDDGDGPVRACLVLGEILDGGGLSCVDGVAFVPDDLAGCCR